MTSWRSAMPKAHRIAIAALLGAAVHAALYHGACNELRELAATPTSESPGAFGGAWSCEQAIARALRAHERAVATEDVAAAAEQADQLEHLLGFCTPR